MNRSDITVVPPVYESLFDVHRRGLLWPDSVLSPEILAEIRKRECLASLLRNIFARLPRADWEMTSAIDSGLVSPAEAEEIYTRLAEFLEVGGQNARILLYLPFELIPDTQWQTESRPLARSISRLHAAYLARWEDLLAFHDVRASFADGDILEDGLYEGPLPKVVKAAHLAWVLVRKHLITSHRVIELIETSRDEVLRQSLANAVKVMHDLNLIGEELRGSSDLLLRGLATELQHQVEIPPSSHSLPSDLDQLKGLVPQIYAAVADLEERLGVLEGKVSPGRIRWLRQRDTEGVIRDFAGRISSALEKSLISMSDLKEFIWEFTSDELLMQAAVEASGRFLETQDPASARIYLTELEPLLTGTALNSRAVGRAQESVRLHLTYLGVIGRGDHALPGERFQLERAVNQVELGQLTRMVESIRADDQLSRMLFPLLLLYGSRVKGYGSADLDLAIMVRPWVGLQFRTAIQESLTRITKEVGIEVSFLEFWLEWESGLLKIRDFQDQDMHMGGNPFAHVLFEAAWIGRADDIKALNSALTSRFILPGIGGIFQAVRDLLLMEIERNTLQFRLMHKGYAHLYPPQGGVATRNSSTIDSGSSFWDSGYRWLATRLFITRVFLP
jgi:hypothetical protein